MTTVRARGHVTMGRALAMHGHAVATHTHTRTHARAHAFVTTHILRIFTHVLHMHEKLTVSRAAAAMASWGAADHEPLCVHPQARPSNQSGALGERLPQCY